MSAYSPVFILTLISMLLAIKGDPFHVHYWYGFPSSMFYNNRMNAKSHFYEEMTQILQLYEMFPENNDISVALALVIVKMNFESVKYYMTHLEAQFKEACDTCKKLFKPYPGKAMNADIDPMLERVERLLSNITNLMLARVPRASFYRPIAQMYLFNDESWMDNIVDFNLIPQLIINDESEELFLQAVPTYNEYENVINNWNFSTPNINETSYCLNHLAYHVIYHHKFPQQCSVPHDCKKFVTEGTSFGWALSHRILLMIFAKFGRNCYYYSMEEDNAILIDMCEWARRNMDMLKHGNFKLYGLTLEYMTFCSLYGHRNIFNILWFNRIGQTYFAKNMKIKGVGNKVGCITKKERTVKTERKVDAAIAKTIEAAYNNKKRAWWQLVKLDTNQVGDCNRHDTAMYLATLASVFRATFQPAYCPYKTFEKGKVPLLEYCFIPRRITFDIINEFITQNENRHNFYDIFINAKICFAYANKSCGPFAVDKKYYYDVDTDHTEIKPWPRIKPTPADVDN